MKRLITSLWLPLLLLASWEALSATRVLDPLFFPTPTSLAPAAARLWATGELPRHLGATFHRLAVGLTVGSILGIATGVLMGSWVFARHSLDPLISGLYAAPKISLLPLLMLLLGIGEAPRMVLIAASAFILMAIQTTDAVRGLSGKFLEIARSCGANRWMQLRRVYLPAILPQLFTGLRLSFGRALLVTISMELVSGPDGIGSMIWMAWQTFSTEKLYIGVILAGSLGIVSNVLLRTLEKRAAPWRES